MSNVSALSPLLSSASPESITGLITKPVGDTRRVSSWEWPSCPPRSSPHQVLPPAKHSYHHGICHNSKDHLSSALSMSACLHTETVKAWARTTYPALSGVRACWWPIYPRRDMAPCSITLALDTGHCEECWTSHRHHHAGHGIMGRRFLDGGLLRYRKWVPQQLRDVIVVTNSPPIGHMRSQLTNHQVGIVLDQCPKLRYFSNVTT